MTEAEHLIRIIEDGKVREVTGCIQSLLDLGYDQDRIVEECVIPALETVGARFEAQEVFIPQMLMAARTVSVGNDYLRKKQGTPAARIPWKVIIGTVKDDLHFIGKNLVAMSMRSVGIEVIDLGVDVSPEQFVFAAENDPDVAIAAVSALLTTTLPAMRKTVKALKNCKASGRIRIMVGGGPVTEEFARSIGADVYTASAYDAAMTAREILTGLDDASGALG